MSTPKSYLVLSALGEDRPGIVSTLTRTILDHGCNIVDSRMTVLGGEFAILLMVQGKWNTLAKMESSISELEKQLEMTIITRRTQEKSSNKNLLPYFIEVVALDHPGIVQKLAEFFSEREINIQDLVTNSYAAAHTGSPMFSVNISVGIPADFHISKLREEFLDYCDTLNLDAVLEPQKS